MCVCTTVMGTCRTVMETQQELSAKGLPVTVEAVAEQFAEAEAAGLVRKIHCIHRSEPAYIITAKGWATEKDATDAELLAQRESHHPAADHGENRARRHPRNRKGVRLFKVTEVVDLISVGRKNVRCHWFVIWRKRPLFGPNGSLQPDYRGVIAAGAHDQDCEFAAEEFFTANEAEAFAEFAGSRLHAHVKSEPAKLPISNDRKSFEALLAERGGDLDMLVLDDGAGNELNFAVGCYDERPSVEDVDKLLAEFEAAEFIHKIHNGSKPTYTATAKGRATKDWKQVVADALQRRD